MAVFLASFVAVTLPKLAIARSPLSPPFAIVQSTPSSNAESLWQQGRTFFEAGKTTEAYSLFLQAVEAFKAAGDRKGEGKALNSVGAALYNLGKAEEAISLWQSALKLVRETGDRETEIRILTNLANVAQAQSQFTQAVEYYHQAITAARSINNNNKVSPLLNSLGSTYLALSNYPKAIESFEKALEIARLQKDQLTEVQAIGNLGIAYDNTGNYLQAISYFQQNLTLARELKNQRSEAAALANLGTSHSFLGEYKKSIEYHQQALALAQSLNDSYAQMIASLNLGVVHNILSDTSQAIRYLETALKLSQDLKNRINEGRILGELGILYFNLGDYQKASEYLEPRLIIARELGDLQGESRVLTNLASLYQKLGKIDQSIDYQKQSLAIAQKIGDLLSEGQSYGNLGGIYFSLNNYQESEKNYKSAINVWENIRAKLGKNYNLKVSIFESQKRSYHGLQEALIAQSKAEEALEIAERGRARAFVELLAERLSPEAAQKVTIAPPTIADIQRIAKSHNSTIIEYSLTQDKLLFMWVIKPQGDIVFKGIKTKDSIPQLIQKSREAVIGAGRRRPKVASEQLELLYNLLIQPIADQLPREPNSRLTIIPHEELFLVPFAALKDEQGKYLIEKHTLLTAPSIQVLELTENKRKLLKRNNLNALVVGNPKMPSLTTEKGKAPQPLSPLPASELEAQEIAKLLQTKAVISQEASEPKVIEQMEKSRLIHLATHGLLDDIEGLGIPGAIALAPEGKFDGFLTSGEIFNLKLNSELVVLSACDTGRGRITGEGVIGLSRALISAGTPSIIVSLWAVPDAPTATLMTEFYQQFQKTPDKAVALRQAMLNTIPKHRFPVEWAAFTLIGEAE